MNHILNIYQLFLTASYGEAESKNKNYTKMLIKVTSQKNLVGEKTRIKIDKIKQN